MILDYSRQCLPNAFVRRVAEPGQPCRKRKCFASCGSSCSYRPAILTRPRSPPVFRDRLCQRIVCGTEQVTSGSDTNALCSVVQLTLAILLSVPASVTVVVMTLWTCISSDVQRTLLRRKGRVNSPQDYREGRFFPCRFFRYDCQSWRCSNQTN